ncbi:MAG: protease pro-enzyme activation domain-containing protein [Terriglobales bacterium]
MLLIVAIAIPIWAQGPSRLVTAPIDESRLITLRGNVHPLAQARYDLGSASASAPTGRLLLLLNRPDKQEAALDQYLRDVHTSGSAAYHQWITPQQFGFRFGPADSEIQAVSAWLSAKGFQVARVSKGRTLIEFSGVVGQVNEAFHTQIHRYEVNGELHYANARDPQIPEALSRVVRGISPLHDFHARPAIHVVGRAHIDPETKKIVPEFDLTGPNGTFHGVAPEDFTTQYDLTPLYSAGINGSGKTIGIINDSNIDVSLDNAYRSLFGLTSNPAQVLVDGGDPGVNPDELEAYLDVEVAGSVAPGATINLYVAVFDTLDDPLILAAQRAIEDNQADVLSISFGNCEANLGTSHNQILNSLWQQAAAQGQTVFVSAGDNGSAGCDDPIAGQVEASRGLAVNGFASTPWDVAVGGTDFYYSDYASGAPSAATLWNATNDANYGSLKGPLPEQVWSDYFGFDVTPNPFAPLYAGSGGVSTIYSKPAWQSGSGVPSDGQRDLPDVTLFAADGANLSGYVICANPGDCTSINGSIPVTVVGGTSASSPAMAGILALVNQKHGRQGQANFILYLLAQQMPTVFHDIRLGGNNVPCVQGSPDCVLGTTGTDNGQYTMSGYPATVGYDLASGLGSVDANVLVSNWSKISFLPTVTTLELSSSTFTHGTAVTFTADVTHSSGSESPTGNVSILTNSALPFSQTQGVLPIGTNGTATGSINSLPGGSYQLWAEMASTREEHRHP